MENNIETPNKITITYDFIRNYLDLTKELKGIPSPTKFIKATIQLHFKKPEKIEIDMINIL